MLVLLFILLRFALALQGRDTTCTVPTVDEGSRTQLTCHFPYNINGIQHGLNVLLYRDTNPNNPITVAYSVISNGKHEFFIHPDFLLDDDVSDRVNIVISKASKAYVGKYVCHSDPSLTAKSCTFILKVRISSEASTPAVSGISTTNAPIFNEKEFRQSENLNNVVIPLMVVLLACIVTLVIGVIFVAVICRKRLKSCVSRTCEITDSSDSVDSMLPKQQSI